MSIIVEISDLKNRLNNLQFSGNVVYVYGIDIEKTLITDIWEKLKTNLNDILCKTDKISKVIFSDGIFKRANICSAYFDAGITTATTLFELLPKNQTINSQMKQWFKIKINEPIVILQVEYTKIVYCFEWTTTLKKALDVIKNEIDIGSKVIYKDKQVNINTLLQDTFLHYDINIIKFENEPITNNNVKIKGVSIKKDQKTKRNENAIKTVTITVINNILNNNYNIDVNKTMTFKQCKNIIIERINNGFQKYYFHPKVISVFLLNGDHNVVNTTKLYDKFTNAFAKLTFNEPIIIIHPNNCKSNFVFTINVVFGEVINFFKKSKEVSSNQFYYNDKLIDKNNNLEELFGNACNTIEITSENNKTLQIQNENTNTDVKTNAIVDTNPKKCKKKTIPKKLKTEVWKTNIGEDVGSSLCLCCKKTKISQSDFHCGHVIAEANGGETNIMNLKPICAQCNLSMGTINMNEFAKLFENTNI